MKPALITVRGGLACLLLLAGALPVRAEDPEEVTPEPEPASAETPAPAAPPDGPYAVIITRNPFSLKPAPAAPLAGASNALARTDIKLAGITIDHGLKTAWLQFPVAPGKTNTTPAHLAIPEGQNQDGIEVLEVNERDNAVRIAQAGQTMTLTFRDNGLPTPATLAVPSPGPTPGQGAIGGRPANQPAGAVPNLPQTAPGGVGRDARTGRVDGSIGQVDGAAAPAAVRTVPGRNIRVAQPAGDAVDPASQYLMMKVNEEAHRQRGLVYPPTPTVHQAPAQPVGGNE